MARNPPWTYDELVVALDLYVNVPRARTAKSEPALQEASDALRALPIHVERPDPVTFRGRESVYLKLQNFKTVDPEYPGVGMPAGAGRRERAVWQRYASDPDELRRVAAAIRREGRTLSPAEVQTDGATDDDEPIVEGRVLMAVHRRRERRASRKKKAAVLRDTGRLACEVCSFDFEKVYGERGKGFAECHHTRPLSTGVRETRLADLAIVCSNCHRMIHRPPTMLSVEELRGALASTSG